MGISVYLNWEDMTQKEEQDQITGFSVVHGHVSYLREAYHGEPYATKILVPEAFDFEFSDEEDERPGVEIPSSVLENRLPDTIKACIEREKTIYGNDDPDNVVKSFVDFVN